LPASLRTHLAGVSRAARASGAGIWARSVADPNGPAVVGGLAQLQTLVCWPKLFRRLVPFLAIGATNLDGFQAWLRADAVNRDDAVFLLDRLENGNLHDVIEAAGNQVRMTVWPEDFVIDPDPAAPGTPTTPTLPAAGDVLILAVLPDPAGADRGHEHVTLLNTTSAAVDLAGWSLHDTSGALQKLAGALPAGAALQITVSAAIPLGNQGDSLTLVDPAGTPIDQVSYKAGEVKPGRTIVFGR